VGIDKSRDRVDAASARAAQAGTARLRYVAMDAYQEPLEFAPTDLVVGLHACGELGDLLVSRAAACGSSAALVSCCLQKIRLPRRMPLSRAAQGLVLARDVLGLANLTSQARGVETDIATTMLSRQKRYALRCLLEGRGLNVPPGAEMKGLNRRATRARFGDIVARVCQIRDLPPPTSAEVRFFEAKSMAVFGRIRRYSLPRNLLGRLVEVAVVCDRAALLAESGLAVQVLGLCEPGVTPRNLAIFACRDSAQLPKALGGSAGTPR
jgi:hypothetical protein